MRNRACGNKNIYIYICFLKKKKKLLPAEPPVPYYNSQNINKKGKNNMVKENFAPIG